jgi:hypothetical protein
MSRPVMALLGALALVLGIGVGVGAGMLAQQPSQPVAVVGSPDAGSVPPGDASPSDDASASAETPSGSAAPSDSVAPSATPAPTPVVRPAPLTGRPVKPAVAAKRVIAVMVDDQFLARPQSGLSFAAQVWQAPAEGGIPRYMALFQDTDPKAVGPIRSSRLYYISWAAEWHAMYVHAGGSPQAMALLRSSKGRGSVVYNADQFRWSKYLYRVSFRFAPHNVYSDAKSLRALAKKVGAKAVKNQKPHWKFAADAPLAQRPKGGKIVVPYLANKITFQYDRKTNTYPRSVTGEGKQYDAATKKPKVRIAPKNVIIMKVVFVPIGDKKHRLDGQVTGSGVAWIATNGKTIKGTWKKKTFSAPIHFYDRKGNEVVLTIGQTFVQVIPRSFTPSIKDGKVPAPAASPSASPAPTPTPSPS